MRQVMSEAEMEKKKQEDKDKRRKESLIDNQSFVKSQIKGKEVSPAIAWKSKVMMNEDEIRYNRDILDKLAKQRG